MKNKIMITLVAAALFCTASIASAVTTITGSVTLSNAASTANYSSSKGVTMSTISTTSNYAVTAAHAGGMNKAKGIQYGTLDSGPTVLQACPGSTAAAHPAPVASATAMPTVSGCAQGIPTALTSTFQ